jgi:2-polyprenyl-3-methyl-5-hydroxy-6-metoxy-1,4-benzoquinol methylase
MPSSYHGYLTDIVEQVRQLHPTSILDMGLGFGKWGMLFREYLDVMHGRVYKNQWKLQLDGVEIYEPYIMDHQLDIYSNIYIGDIITLIDDLPSYDLIFTSDVLEHLPKEQGLDLVQKVLHKSKHFIAAIPIGDRWLHSQGAMFGNAHEAHISSWQVSDIRIPKGRQLHQKTYMCNNKPITVVVI